MYASPPRMGRTDNTGWTRTDANMTTDPRLAKILEAMRALIAQGEPTTLPRISARTGIPTSTVARLCRRMREADDQDRHRVTHVSRTWGAWRPAR